MQGGVNDPSPTPRPVASIDLSIAPELLERLSRPGPRYTSYPTAVVFEESFGPAQHREALQRFGASGRPLSLYVHLPFCRSLCHYCACNVVISRDPTIAGRYLDDVEREADLVASAVDRPARVLQLHLGGGTPTFLTPDELQRLHRLLAERFDLSAPREQAVEVDPRATSREQLEVLAELGWNRASFGVQDFDPQVQWAINRVQSVEQTEALVEAARELGYGGINVDLIYGLPFQQAETFARTLDEVLRIRPDRIALYSYAHLPRLRPAQGRFERKSYPLPGAAEKYALFRQAVLAFLAAGYQHIGMDHFALPEDELAQAQGRGELHRNFQGYTVRAADDLIGLGVSAISDVAGAYAQSARELPEYRAALAQGELPTVRGWRLSADDLARREAITALMTGSPLSDDFAERYAEELAGMDDLVQDGLVEQTDTGVAVTPLGRFFIRNVAMRFDRYLPRGGRPLPQFSRTV